MDVVSELDPQATSELLESLVEMGIGAFLQINPIRLEIRPQVLFLGRQVNGIFDFKTQTAQIAFARNLDEYAVPYQKQKFFSISHLGMTPHACVARSLAHELGHHLHHVLKAKDFGVFRQTMYAVLSDSLSQYGLSNPYEYFAECFAAFVYHRAELFMDDKFGYAMLERSLERLSLEIRELP
jgi:hypothetical protein